MLATALLGMFAFATSGALLAIRKDFDAIGILLLAGLTATGGGVMRDLIIGATPPAAFTNLWYLVVPVVAAIVTSQAQNMIAVTAAVLIFGFRVVALRRGWHAPRAWHRDPRGGHERPARST